MSLDGLSPAAIVARLELRPHPEGGYYRETFRDEADGGGRALSTAIYYLLGAGDRSAWHRVDAAEVWHHYAGAPLELRLSRDGRSAETAVIGPDHRNGVGYQLVVPRGCWQTARSLGEWSLAGCTVAPGFVFDGFELAPPGFDPA